MAGLFLHGRDWELLDDAADQRRSRRLWRGDLEFADADQHGLVINCGVDALNRLRLVPDDVFHDRRSDRADGGGDVVQDWPYKNRTAVGVQDLGVKKPAAIGPSAMAMDN
jgi:hypothetical protein